MIVTRTPFRVSFIGGGTDIPEIYRRIPKGCCVGMTIDKYMWIAVNKRFDSNIRVSYSSTEIVKNVSELHHNIARECLKATEMTSGIEVVSIADIPGGTGLGSSSAYTVGLLNALYHLQGCVASPATLARQAIEIELDVLGKSMGIQDMFMSAYGGLMGIHISKGAIRYLNIEPSLTVTRLLKYNTKLLYVGGHHIAEAILAEQIKNSTVKLEEYKHLATLAETFSNILQQQLPLTSFANYIKEGWEIKKRLSSSITNEHIDSLIDKLYIAGAVGVKLCGAGACGFLLVVFPTSAKQSIENLGLRELPFSLERYGSMVTLFS